MEEKNNLKPADLQNPEVELTQNQGLANKKPARKGLKVIVWVLIALLLAAILAGIGYFGYTKILLPNKVIDSVNINIDTYNSLEEKAKAALDISSKTTQEFDFNKPQTLQKVKENSQLLRKVKESYSDDKNLLKQGPNSDSEEFYNLTLENFKAKEEALQLTINLNDFQVCLFDNYTKIISSNTKIQDIGAQASRTAEKVAKEELQGQFSKETTAASETILNIKFCFVSDFKDLQTQEIKNILNTSSQYYLDIGSGKEVSGLPVLFESKNSSLLVDGALQLLAQKNISLERLDAKLEKSLKEIKDKYRK